MSRGTPNEAGGHRYKRIVDAADAIDRLMVALFLEAPDTAPGEFVLNIDATNDPLYGHQEGRFIHGYHDCFWSLPLSITCGDHVLRSRPRSSIIDLSSGSVTELARIVGQIRASWPTTRILVRGDSGFCREEIMAWCETHDVDSVFGLARTPRLVARIARQMRWSHSRCVKTGRASRRFRDFRYRTLTSWSRARLVVCEAELFAGETGAEYGPTPRPGTDAGAENGTVGRLAAATSPDSRAGTRSGYWHAVPARSFRRPRDSDFASSGRCGVKTAKRIPQWRS